MACLRGDVAGLVGRGSKRFLACVLFAAVFAGACGAPGGGEGVAGERRSSGAASPGGESDDWLDEPEALLELGGVEGPVFHDIVAVLASGDALVVIEDSPPRLRRMALTGGVLQARAVGGEGPGEFRAISSAVRGASDSLFLFDGRSRRLTVMDSALVVDRTVRLVGDDAPSLSRAEPGLGGIVASAGVQVVPGERAEGFHRLPLRLLLFDADGTFRRVIAEVPGPEIFVAEGGGFVRPLLPRRTVWVAGTEGLWVGVAEAPVIRRIDGAANSVVTLRVPASGDRLDAVREERIVDALARRAESEAYARRVRATAELTGFRVRLPPYGRLLLDEEGRLWMSDYVDPASPEVRWQVLTPDGGRVAELTLPSDFTVTDLAGDRVIGVRVDHLGVERVVAFRVRP